MRGLGGAVGDPGRDHPAVAVADEETLREVFDLEHRDNVVDVGVEVDIRVGEVHAFADAGVGRGVELVAALTHQGPHFLPRPPCRPRAVRYHECCHSSPPIPFTSQPDIPSLGNRQNRRRDRRAG